MRVVLQAGDGRRTSLIAGFSFWVGVGVQFQAILPGYLATDPARMLVNGLTAGGISILRSTCSWSSRVLGAAGSKCP